MNVLAICQRICDEAGLPRPSALVNATDSDARRLLATIYRVGADLLDRSQWPQLNRDASITLVAAQADYALPSDFDGFMSDTHWNATSGWPLRGPMSPMDWQTLQHGVPAASISQKWRIRGYAQKQLFIFPTPTDSDASQVLAYEYQSKNWIRPRTWETGLVFVANSYCFYNGYYFFSAAGGTSGATAPTPSALNDGGVTWTLFTDPYTTFTADTDEFNLDEELVGLGIAWRFLARRNLPFVDMQAAYETRIRTAMAKISGAPVIGLSKSDVDVLINTDNVPDTGYGGV